MQINEFKERVSSGDIKSNIEEGIVLKVEDETSFFIIRNYLEVIKGYGYDIINIDGYDEIECSLFEDKTPLYVISNNSAEKRSNVIVICDNDRNDITCVIPKMEQWQFTDLMCAKLPGLEQSEVEGLYGLYNGEYSQFYEDMKKIECFDESTQKLVTQELIESGAFDRRTTKTVFDLVTSLVRDDVAGVKNCYKSLYYIDKEPTMLILTLLVKNFRQAFIAQTCRTVTAEQLGVTEKQLEVIKRYNCGYYSNKQLEDIYFMLTGVEDKFKTGGLEYENVVSYIIVNILGV